MHNIFIFFTAFLMAATYSSAQKVDFTPGKAILSLGDTLSGQIYDQDWQTSPTSVRFVDDTGLEHKLRPQQTTSFYIARRDEWWVTKTFTYTDVVVNGVRNEESFIRPVKTTAFIQSLYRNALIALYSYTDERNRPHYFVEKEGSFIELINYVLTKRNQDGITSSVQNSQYRNQLGLLLSDCAQYKVPNGLDYEETPLVNELGNYCALRNGVTYQARTRRRFTTQILPSAYYYLHNNLTDDTVYPSITSKPYGIGISIRLMNNRGFSRTYAQVGVDYNNYIGTSVLLISVQSGLFLIRNSQAPIQPFVEAGVTLPLLPSLGAGISIKKRFQVAVQRIGFASSFSCLRVSYAFGRIR